MDYTQILIKPIVTEKSTMLKELVGQVAFMVRPDANKIAVRKAVEEAFDVRVTKVSIVNRKPRQRSRFGRKTGTKSGWKKAYVSLAEGQRIDLFEGV